MPTLKELQARNAKAPAKGTKMTLQQLQAMDAAKQGAGPVGPTAPASSKGFSGIGNMLTGKAPVQQVGPVAPNTVQERNNRETTRSSTPEEQKVLDKKAVQTQFDKFAGRAGNRLPIDDAVDAVKGSVKSAYQEGAGTNNGSIFGRAKSFGSGIVNLPHNLASNEVYKPIIEGEKASFGDIGRGISNFGKGNYAQGASEIAKGVTGAVATPIGTALALPLGGSSFVGGALKQPMDALHGGIDYGVRKLGGDQGNVETAQNVFDTLMNVSIVKGGKKAFNKMRDMGKNPPPGGDGPDGGAPPGGKWPLAGEAWNDPTANMTRSQKKTVQKRVTDLGKIEQSKASLRNYTAKQKDRGIDPKSDIAKTDLLVESVDNTGTVRTKQEGGAVQQYNEFIKPMEKVVSKVLKQEGATIPLEEVAIRLKRAVNDSGMKGASRIDALNKIDREIEGYRLDADAKGNVPISTIHEAKVDKYANVNYMNEGGRLDKTIAKQLKQIVEEKTTSADVKSLNQELSRHYANIGYLEKLDGAKVEGGRLGKHFARLTGTVVGAAFGSIGGGIGSALGGALGAELAGGIKGRGMSSTFGKKTGGQLGSSQLMQNALQSSESSNNLGSRKTNQSPNTIPAKTVNTIPIKEVQSKPSTLGKKSTEVKSETVFSGKLSFKSTKPETFIEAVKRIPEEYGVSPYTSKEYAGMKIGYNAKNDVGYAIKPDGDIVSVFNNSPIKGLGIKAVKDAIKNGGTKLDAFDGYLKKFYENLGFKEYKRESWNDKYAPKNWNYEKKGKPDIIYFKLD